MVSLFSWGASNKKIVNPSDAQTSDLLAPAMTIVALPVNGTAFNPPRAIIADQKGSATITDFNGNTLTGFPLTGNEQAIGITAISNLSTSTAVWGLY